MTGDEPVAGEARARSLTVEDLKAAMDRALQMDHETTAARVKAYLAFIDAVPPEFKDHPEILQMAAIASWSVMSPIHPKDAERMMARYEQIIQGGS